MPHIHEKIDFTVDVFIVHENRVLLRFHEKYHKWLVPGGHIELDEDPVQAIIREAKEEVGLDITIPQGKIPFADDRVTPIPTPAYMGRHRVNEVHEHVFMVYFATCLSDKILDSMSVHERAETRWVTMEELEIMDLLPNIKFYAQEALKELS